MVQAHNGTGMANARDALQQSAPLLLSVPQAARLLGIGTTLCWDMVHSGQLLSVRLGRRVLIPRAALERLVSINDKIDNSIQ